MFTYSSKKNTFRLKHIISVILFFGFLVYPVTSQAFQVEFITTWSTDGPGTSNDDQVTIPTSPHGEVYNYDIYWEEIGDADNNGNLIGQTGDVTITFPSIGIYRIEISGDFPRIYFNDSGDKGKINSIEQWGNIEWTSMENAFWGCEYIFSMSTSDEPDLSAVSSMRNMFRGAQSTSADIGSWDVSNVNDMSGMFYSASNFNGNISGWNVSSVTDMSYMFSFANSFNQDISGWNVSSVTNMEGTFYFAEAFSQDITSWNVANVTNMSRMFQNLETFNQDISGWDVSNVTNLSFMFSDAPAFNQDISSWDVSNVTDMSYMFSFASSFNQDLSNWNVGIVTNMQGMLSNSGLSNENYENTLIGWSELGTLQNDVSLGANGLSYCLAEGARSILIDTYNWFISGDIQDCSDIMFTGEGSGTELDPYQIETPEQLNTIRYKLSDHFILVGNIDLSSETGEAGGQFWNDGKGWDPIGEGGNPFTNSFNPFTGSLNGNGYRISGLTISRENESRVALFSMLDSAAVIKNLILEDVDIKGKNIAGIVSQLDSSSIENSHVSGVLTGLSPGMLATSVNRESSIINSSSSGTVLGSEGSSAGGLVSFNQGEISNSFSEVNVIGFDLVGGLVGDHFDGKITGSHATGNVSGKERVGGLVGYVTGETAIIEDSYAIGFIEGETHVGGLVGQIDGIIKNSYSSSHVVGVERIGGLAGQSWGGTIDSSRATGKVEGSDIAIGGLVGWADGESQITTSHATGDVYGESGNVGGLVGRHRGNSIIKESYSSGMVYSSEGSFTGGLAGSHESGSITFTFAAGDVSGSQVVGGLVGVVSNDAIIDSSFATGTVTGGSEIGGFVGRNRGEINYTFATGDVYGNGGAVGGFVGTNEASGIITNSFSIGPIDGNNAVGGMLGLNFGTLSNSYSTGRVHGSETYGGLIGNDSDDTVTNSFWNTETSGLGSSAGGTGLTTSEMMQEASFIGWDFDTIWTITENESYPVLRESPRPSSGPFTLLAPANLDQTDLPSDFIWEEFPDAESYRMQISEHSNFITTVLDTSGIKGTFFEVSGLSQDSSYYWRVAAEDSLGPLAWSDEFFININVSTNTEKETAPIQFSLSQNYPNPFNPTTEIKYALPEATQVQITVYDMLGRQVAKPVNKHQTAGYQSLNFDASSLASGVYIYQIVAGKFVQARKMLLVK